MSLDNWFCKDTFQAKEYLDACVDAVNDEHIFNSFKSLTGYQHILEHTSVWQGQIYANEILKLIEICNLDKNKIIETAKINDFIGSPSLSNYENFKMISPSTLRYLLFSLRIKKIIGENQIENFLDIGGGYGGMSLIANKIIGTKNIYLNDLKEVLNLQKKYLLSHELNCYTEEKLENLEDKKFDLCVSTFAFSELTKKHRDKIISKIFPNCKIIYLVCNFINNEVFDDREIFEFAQNSYEILFEKEPHENHLCSTFTLIKKP